MGVAYLVVNLYISGMDKAAAQRARDYAVLLKRGEVVRMRLEGKSYAEIVATGLYSSRSGARYAFVEAIKDRYHEPTEAARLIEVARIEALIAANWDAAINGPGVKIKIEAGNYVLKLINSKCAILGINAPQKIDLVGMLSSIAAAAGVDPEEAIREADGLVTQHTQYGRA